MKKQKETIILNRIVTSKLDIPASGNHPSAEWYRLSAHSYRGKSGVESKMGNSPDSTKAFIMDKWIQLLQTDW